MRLNRIISFSMALLLLSITFVGCSVQRYDAEIYSYVNDRLVPTFLENNKLSGISYTNPEYDEDEALKDDNYAVPKYLGYPDAPTSRTFIITDEETFNSMYVEGALEVDFEKEMVILYMYRTSTHRSRVFKIDKIEVEGDTLNIYFKQKFDKDKIGVSDAVMRYQRCMTVKMKKIEVSTVNFIKILPKF